MATFNITEVRLLSVPLENDYKHTLYFESVEAQTEYFLSRPAIGGVNFSYQRKDGYIAYPRIYDSLIGYNYVMYKNSAYGNKWFYAFITDMKYVNDERTDIYIETDVIQTWWKQYVVKPSFIEREHVKNDAVGENILDEGLQLGEYVCNRHSKPFLLNFDDGGYIIVGVTQSADGSEVGGRIYNGIYSGLKYYAFPNTSNGADDLRIFLKNYYDSEGAGEAVQCMFYAPSGLVQNNVNANVVTSNTKPLTYKMNQGGDTEQDFSFSFANLNIDGYTPRNNKLLCYPYRYLMVGNNAGGSAIYFYELFKDGGIVCDPRFTLEACLTIGISARLVPAYYKGVDRNDEEGLTLGKYPALNWTSDIFTNWCTQNAINIGVELGVGLAETVGGIALAGATFGLSMGGAVSGVSSILSTLGKVYEASLVPPQSKGNLNSGDVVTATNENEFHFYDMSIRSQYAKIIDEYFDMFGYKVSRVKVPEENHRQRYWYTKTIDANIDGAIPNDDISKIKACYNNGITFWRSTEAIGYYSTVDINGNKVYNPIVYN